MRGNRSPRGMVMLPLTFWWIVGGTFGLSAFAINAVFAIPAVAVFICIYGLSERKPWPLPILTALSIVFVLIFAISFQANILITAAAILWLPLLTWLTTYRQIDYGALFARNASDARGVELPGDQSTSPGVCRGSLFEPYCSQSCRNSGAIYAASVMRRKEAGVCGFCQKQIFASVRGASECVAIPFEGKTLFVCADCMDKALSFILGYRKCCMCQDAIEPDITPR